MKMTLATRRRFLTLSAAAAGGTLLERSIYSTLARADGVHPRRFIGWYSGYGAAPAAWYPRGTTALEFGDATVRAPGTGPMAFVKHDVAAASARLRATSGAGTGIVLNPTDSVSACLDARLNPYLDSILLVRGIDQTGLKWVGHNPFTAFSAKYWEYEDAPPYAQVTSSDGKPVGAVTTLHKPMTMSKAVYPRIPAFDVLCFRSQQENADHDPRLYKEVRDGKEFVVPTFFDPASAWAAIFEPLLRGGATQDGGRPLALSYAIARLNKLSQNTNLSARDAAVLKEKADILNVLGTSSADIAKLAPPKPTLPTKAAGDPGSWRYNDSTRMFETSPYDLAVCKAQIDLMVAAIKLDLSRVFGFLPMNRSANFHQISHNRAYSPENESTQSHMKDIVERYVYLLGKLDVEEAGTGRSYLDNTMVLWHSDMGNISNHLGNDIITMYAGAKGFLDAGRFLDLRHPERRLQRIIEPETQTQNDKRSHYSGRSHSEALITAMRWMGLTPPEWEGFRTQGLLQFCPKVGGYTDPQTYDYGDKRSGLPFATL